MTNKQLVIILNTLNRQLEQALDRIKEQLPERYQLRIVNTVSLAEVTTYPILDPLYEVIKMLDISINDLRKAMDNNNG